MNHPLLKTYEKELVGDDHLFYVVDLNLPPEQQVPVTMVGHHVEDKLRKGHYHVEYIGENPTSRANLAKEGLEENRRVMGTLKLPITIQDQKKALEDENAELKALLEKHGLQLPGEEEEPETEAEEETEPSDESEEEGEIRGTNVPRRRQGGRK